MKEKIIQMFNSKCGNKTAIHFIPDVKVARSLDILYLQSITKTNVIHKGSCYHVIITMGTSIEEQRMPLDMLDELSLKAIYLRLRGTREKLLEK